MGDIFCESRWKKGWILMFNNYTGQRSEYIKSIKRQSRCEAYAEMADEVMMEAKKREECGMISLKDLKDIIDDRLDCYFDVYGEEKEDGEE